MQDGTRQISMDEVTAEYKEFIDKFKPKLTTDDCYTPENVYAAVREWVFEHYSLPADTPVVRPFWPGGDYERAEYPEGCVVIDNPPFSKMKAIEQFYLNNGIRFFLFAPGLSLFKPIKELKYILTGVSIIYANGASINTSFVTSMGEYLIETEPELCEKIEEANKQNAQKGKKQLPKYEYQLEVVTSARCNYYANHGMTFRVRPEEAYFVRKLDAQGKEKGMFGAGFLISERAAAERAAALRWSLSDRERKIVQELSKK